jgi:hypothetical protein
MYFRLLALEDVKITYENNDFVNYADQFYLKTLYSFAYLIDNKFGILQLYRYIYGLVVVSFFLDDTAC